MPRGRSRAKVSTRPSSAEGKAGGALILSGVFIDQMVPFDWDAREGESPKSRAALRPMMPGLEPTTCTDFLAVLALRRGAASDSRAVSECRRKRNGTHVARFGDRRLEKEGVPSRPSFFGRPKTEFGSSRLAATERARSGGSCIIHA